MFKCPSDPDIAFGYGVNYPNIIAYLPFTPWVSTHNRVEFRDPFSITEIPRPSETIVMADSWGHHYFCAPTCFDTRYHLDTDYDGDGTLDTSSSFMVTLSMYYVFPLIL